MSLTVWVVEVGSHSDAEIVGVYASLEAAMEANPATDASGENNWRQSEVASEGVWVGGHDWGTHASITPFRVQGESS